MIIKYSYTQPMNKLEYNTDPKDININKLERVILESVSHLNDVQVADVGSAVK